MRVMDGEAAVKPCESFSVEAVVALEDAAAVTRDADIEDCCRRLLSVIRRRRKKGRPSGNLLCFSPPTTRMCACSCTRTAPRGISLSKPTNVTFRPGSRNVRFKDAGRAQAREFILITGT